MQATKMKFLCSTENMTKWDRIRNEIIGQSMEEIRKRRRLEWYGHVRRM
jgi:hypothetical protein